MKAKLLKWVRKNYKIYTTPKEEHEPHTYYVEYKNGSDSILYSAYRKEFNGAMNWIINHIHERWIFYFYITNFKNRRKRGTLKERRARQEKQSRLVYFKHGKN